MQPILDDQAQYSGNMRESRNHEGEKINSVQPILDDQAQYSGNMREKELI